MNNKKLKITEAQYNRLLQFIVETPFDTMVKQSIDIGDVVSINWKGSKNNFKVIDNSGGQIIMDNIDKGSTNINNRYFMSFTSLNGDDLEMRKVNKVKEPEKLNDIKSWSPVTVKDISNIQIFRDGELIDTVDPVSPTAEKQQKNGPKPDTNTDNNPSPDFMNEVNNDLAIILEQLEKGKGINFIFNSGFINFCCLDRVDSTFILEINEEQNTIIDSLNKWDTFILDIKGNPQTDNLYLKNKDIVSTNDGVTYNLKFKVSAGNTHKETVIKAIKGVSVLSSCDTTEEDEDEKPEVNGPEEQKADAEKALQMILKDKDLQDAFYKQPGFWEMFKAELSGEKAVGTGIITVLDVMRKVTESRLVKKVGKGFNVGKKAKFIPIENVNVKYRDDKDIIHNYDLPMVEDMITVRRHLIDDVSQVLQKRVEGGNGLILRILVKDQTDEPNIKNCDVQIGIKNKSDKFVEKGQTSDVNIKFLNSEGYEAQVQQPQTQNTN